MSFRFMQTGHTVPEMTPQNKSPRSLELRMGLAGLVIFAVSGVIGWLTASEHEAFNWEVAALCATAFGTTALAYATGLLVRQTGESVGLTSETLRLAREDQVARSKAILL